MASVRGKDSVLLVHLNTEQATEPTHSENQRSTHNRTQQGVQWVFITISPTVFIGCLGAEFKAIFTLGSLQGNHNINSSAPCGTMARLIY